MKTPFRPIGGAVTAPKGFRGAGISAGIKRSGRPDLVLLASDSPAIVAGTFTTNRVKAAPLKVTMPRVARGIARAIIANSGNANCCTGQRGIEDAKESCAMVASQMGISPMEVLVCSTGHIGIPMPMKKIRAAIPKAVAALSSNGGPAAARAMMTTDTFPKTCAIKFSVSGKTVRIGGACKGAGMIAPRMTAPHATMLCFLTTDIAIARRALQSALNTSVAQSFNCITVDGDMSTNDTLLLLANGRAGNKPIRTAHPTFQAALNHVTLTLAKMITRDGEGATKLVTIRILGAASDADAELAARAIAESPLNKCSFAGGDPNWGRLMDALGYSGARVNEEKVEIRYDDVLAVKNGIVAAGDLPRTEGRGDRGPSAGSGQASRSQRERLQKRLKKICARKEFTITVNLHISRGSATIYTCDLTEQYVQENLGE